MPTTTDTLAANLHATFTDNVTYEDGLKGYVTIVEHNDRTWIASGMVFAADTGAQVGEAVSSVKVTLSEIGRGATLEQVLIQAADQIRAKVDKKAKKS